MYNVGLLRPATGRAGRGRSGLVLFCFDAATVWCTVYIERETEKETETRRQAERQTNTDRSDHWQKTGKKKEKKKKAINSLLFLHVYVYFSSNDSRRDRQT